MSFVDFNRIDFKQKRDRIFVKSIAGKHSQLCLIRLEPGAVTGHSHPQEQIGLVFAGRLEITIGKETRILRKGEGYLIPGGVDHCFRVQGEEAVEYIEFFSPPKNDNRTD